MSDTAFDTLGAARRLKAAGIETEQAEAIVEVMDRSVNQLVTVERFEAGIARLDARIDSVRIEVRAELARSHLISVGVIIAANALMMTILGMVLARGAGLG